MKLLTTTFFIAFCLMSFGQSEAKIGYAQINTNDSTTTISFLINFKGKTPTKQSRNDSNAGRASGINVFVDTLKIKIYNQLSEYVIFYYNIPKYISDIIDYIENDSLKSLAISTYTRETFIKEIKTISSSQIQLVTGEMKTNFNLTINFVICKEIKGEIILEPIMFYYNQEEFKTNRLKIKI